MELKHTPGPWTAYKRPEPVGFAEWEIHYGTDTECVAEVVHEEGNARLLAAAPDLLAALQGILRVADRATYEFDAARDAIAKATGSAQ